MSTKKLDLTSYDYDELRNDFIEFVKAYNPEFSDIDYEGSNISLINAILSRNTQLTGYAANFLASESLWSTTNLRKNLVAQASQVSYVPKSRTASKAVVDITITPSTPPSQTSISAPEGLIFISSVGGETAYFSNTSSFVLSLVNGVYVASDIEIYEGSFDVITKVYTQNTPIVIEDTNIDTSTLKVFVDNSAAELSDTEYVLASTIKDISQNSYTYFLTMNQDGQYEIRFGQDTFGIEPPEGAVIKLKYISNEIINNNASTFICGDTIEGYGNISVTVTQPSFGGAVEEDIESIRFLAPLAYQAQERVVNGSDAVALLKQEYSFIKSGRSWGGEKHIPPKFGSIIISLITNDGSTLSPYIKDQMVSYLDDYVVGSITPVIIDPLYIKLNPTISIVYDRSISSKTFASVRTEIQSIVDAYNTEITDFDRFFNTSELVSRIKDITEVISAYVDSSLAYEISVVSSQNYLYEFSFVNPISSVECNDLIVDITADSQRIYDNSGILYYEKTINGQVTTREIGTVDYTSGKVTFELNSIQGNTLVFNAVASKRNIYSSLNNIITINDTTITEVSE